MNVNHSIYFCAAPDDAERLLQYSIEFLSEQINAIQKAESYCRTVAKNKETNERPAFLSLAQEYQQLIKKVFHQLTDLRGHIV